jgi:hypothetical protein
VSGSGDHHQVLCGVYQHYALYQHVFTQAQALEREATTQIELRADVHGMAFRTATALLFTGGSLNVTLPTFKSLVSSDCNLQLWQSYVHVGRRTYPRYIYRPCDIMDISLWINI